MLLLHNFLSKRGLNYCILRRLYSNKKVIENMSKKQVHEEIMRLVNPMARISICVHNINLTVRPSDLHDYPNGDALIAELHGVGNNQNYQARMQVKVSDDDKEVSISVNKSQPDDNFHCELAVPIRANLHIDANAGVNVSNMQCDDVHVTATSNIAVNNIRATNIKLCSEEGNVKCGGLLLGKNTTVQAKNDGNILLDRLQGDNLSCKTHKGNICTNSCYVEKSKFETSFGCLNLKNVHKSTSVYVYEKGGINMTGISGNIYVRSSGGSLNLQLSQLTGENIVQADGIDGASINISDEIELNTHMQVTASPEIRLDNSLAHLSKCIQEDKQNFCLANEKEKSTNLLVFIKGSEPVTLGKSSWADNLKKNLVLKKQS